MSMPPVKKIVVWLIVIFLLYAIFTNPNDAADLVAQAWNIIEKAIKNIFEFFDSLLRKT
ncbi:MAG TPA: hypothetical protein PKH97_15855 [Tetrasphaera sp.]|uniref:hypothetical protein n=1 Tax=Nostocoides sp. TaxID=1917966 RepID=UPI002D176CEF|nr:hypothetical protein [Tetrasphaera sp.]HNQ08641.1 hypothetical protein [Tetrasphaera sp.]